MTRGHARARTRRARPRADASRYPLSPPFESALASTETAEAESCLTAFVDPRKHAPRDSAHRNRVSLSPGASRARGCVVPRLSPPDDASIAAEAREAAKAPGPFFCNVRNEGRMP